MGWVSNLFHLAVEDEDRRLQPPTTEFQFLISEKFMNILARFLCREKRFIMKNDPSIVLTETDFRTLLALTRSIDSEMSALLEEEISRAVVVAPEKFPLDAVSMNSTVKFVDIDTSKESVVTLVYPHEADIEQNRISILAPVGIALIGLRVGQNINWPLPNGKEKKLRIVSVLAQSI